MLRTLTPPPAAGIDELVKHYRNVKPPLYPRKDFYRLSFPDDVTTRERILWKNKYQQHLQQDVGIPSKNPVAIRNIYVQRSKTHIIDNLQKGKYGGISFVCSDENPANRYRHFILRGFPLDEEFDLLEKNLGDKLSKHIFKLIRMRRNGQPTTSLRIIWSSHDETPPNELALYMDMATGESPSMVIEEVKPRPPTCYGCKEEGHIKKWCPKQDGIDSVAHGNTNQQQERAGNIIPKKKHPWPSDNSWLGGAVMQRTEVPNKGEHSDEQHGYKKLMQEIEEMRKEINHLKTQVHQQQNIIMAINRSPLAASENDQPLTASICVDDNLDDSCYKKASDEDAREGEAGTDDKRKEERPASAEYDSDLSTSDGNVCEKISSYEIESAPRQDNSDSSMENEGEKGEKESVSEIPSVKKGMESQQHILPSPNTKAHPNRVKRACALKQN